MTKNYSDLNSTENEPRTEVIKRIMAFSKAFEANKNIPSDKASKSSSVSKEL